MNDQLIGSFPGSFISWLFTVVSCWCITFRFWFVRFWFLGFCFCFNCRFLRFSSFLLQLFNFLLAYLRCIFSSLLLLLPCWQSCRPVSFPGQHELSSGRSTSRKSSSVRLESTSAILRSSCRCLAMQQPVRHSVCGRLQLCRHVPFELQQLSFLLRAVCLSSAIWLSSSVFSFAASA